MGLLDLVFPKTCLSCGREGKYICENCIKKVPLLKSVCPYCEKPSIDGFTHVKCGRVYGLDGLTSIWDYEGVIKKAILSLKYKYALEVAKLLGDLFVEQLQTSNLKLQISNLNVLTPIPLHWHKENVRGFNQSIEIGKVVAEKMGWKFVPDLLIKKQSTVSQAGLSVEKRKQNLQGVFTVNLSYQLTNQPINYSSIVVFDDVFTTGSTLKEAAKVLKRAGVKKVWGLTIAR